MSKLGTRESPCTATNSDAEFRRWKFCLCSECGLVDKCRPGRDFYSTKDNKLLCDTCINGGRPVLDLRPRYN